MRHEALALSLAVYVTGERLDDPDLLDVTGADPMGAPFAPSQLLIEKAAAARRAVDYMAQLGHEADALDAERLERATMESTYRAEMRELYGRSRGTTFVALLDRERVILFDGGIGHGRVLAGILAKLGAQYRGALPESPVGLARVISGGQTGVDVAALEAAREAGVATGGMMPKGWRTLDGPRPGYAQRFGMAEHDSPSYAPRTYANVEATDVTVRIALDFESAGERCTMNAIQKYGREWANIQVRRRADGTLVVDEQDIFDAAEIVVAESRRLGRRVTVNVAGNSEKSAPGIGRLARGVVRMLIEAIACVEV